MFKHKIPLSRFWAADYDYRAKLTQQELDWLVRFTNEYYSNSGLKDDEALHNTPELKRAVYSATNSALRDLYAKKQCMNQLKPLKSLDKYEE